VADGSWRIPTAPWMRGRERGLRLGADAGYFALALPALALVALLVVAPLARIVDTSLEGGAGAYGDVLTSGSFRASLRATLELSALVTLLCLVLAYPLAYLLTIMRSRRVARALLLGVLLCLWISALVRTYAWTVVLGRNGVINELLTAVGIRDQPAELIFNRFAVVVGMTHYLLPFMVLTLYTGMSGIDRRLEQAARTLGASGLRSFAAIFLPLSRPAIFAGCTIVFVLATGFFVMPALLGGPQDATLSVYIERQLYYLEFGNASAAALIMLAIVSAIFVVADRAVGLDRLFAATRAG
jgi:putative spermidine/putrescine transport system permease protein